MYVSLKSICLYLWFFTLSFTGFCQSENQYQHFVDSADVYIDEDSEKALSFINAIPEPIEEHIKGRLADYYAIKSLIHDDFNEYTKQYQCNILAYKYAKKENNFCAAAEACIAIFSNLYYIKKDTLGFKYLDEAKAYYAKCDDDNGAIIIEQHEAYAKFLDAEYEACNLLLLSNLNRYKSIKDDAYYYMFALYMITSDYIYLGNLQQANYYFKEFKKLKNNPTIVDYNYFSFEANINLGLAEAFFGKELMDSTRIQLEKSSKLKAFMTEDALQDYYNLYTKWHKYKGDIKLAEAYIDSLLLFQNKMHNNTLEASFEINKTLLKAENKLIIENKEQTFISSLFGILIFVLLLFGLLGYVYYYKQRSKYQTFNSDAINSLTFLKANNEQLNVKVHGLEAYIKELKDEVKNISRTDSVDKQKNKIKELYKNLHINSSTLLDKSDSHLDIINNLNIEFFKNIQEVYPQLNKSEIIICYYLVMGFTNKEIALFLNTTIRSVESRRYRIAKKIHLNTKETSLLEHLQDRFSETLNINTLI
jgi:DNA-binding CsgD family transcriptional regulator